MNRDGRADVYGGTSQEGEFAGEGFVFNGQSGALLYPLRFPDPLVGEQGWSMTRTDYNGDGTPDVYVGTASSSSLPTDQNGGTYVYDGRSGALLKALELPDADRQVGVAGNTGPFLGWAVADLGDVNGDGGSDYAAAAAPYDEGSVVDVGRVYFFLSRVPPVAPRPQTPAPTPPPGAATPAAPFAGCPAATASVVRGTAASESISGTANADRIFAGTGDDVVEGLAGDDCIDLGAGADRGQGGAGGDLIVGGLGRDRISGNLGDDRLAGNAGGDSITGNAGNDSIEGNAGADRIVGSSGRDRLAGGAGNDRVEARDGQRDRVSCGAGRDTVVADAQDRVGRDCERVRRSRPKG